MAIGIPCRYVEIIKHLRFFYKIRRHRDRQLPQKPCHHMSPRFLTVSQVQSLCSQFPYPLIESIIGTIRHNSKDCTSLGLI